MQNSLEIAIKTSEQTHSQAAHSAIDTRALCARAAAGLVRMFYPERQLFCYRVKPGGGGLIREGVSHRYTIMAVLGLHRFEAAGGTSPVDIGSIVDGLFADSSWIDNPGDIGLMLWLCAVIAPERFESLPASLRADTALERFGSLSDGRTMELAWLLAGLAHAAQAIPHKRNHLEEQAARTYRLLRNNQGKYGFFGHLRGGKLVDLWRRRIGSFADQVYPIYALAHFGKAYRSGEALEAARRCAEAICRVQGPFGQWWWHYDAWSGRVCQMYPVYSVHQDAMAPMALFALGDATELDYAGPIYRGLDWIAGNNEVACDMQETSSNLIWRSVYRKGSTVPAREFWNFVQNGCKGIAGEQLQVLQESRPYHPGWLLYAFAGCNAKPDCCG